MEMCTSVQGRLIFGGSFNPPHIGHLRLAIEVREALGKLIDRVDLMPCAHPPHKASTDMLPFELRASMLDAAIAGLPDICCNRLEGGRDKTSYTWDTLTELNNEKPGRTLFFLLGSPDFALLPTWHRGLDLPRICHLVIVPRGEYDVQAFSATASILWPGVRQVDALIPGGVSLLVPHCNLMHFLPVPWLDVSSSRIRELWQAGRETHYLMPDVVLDILQQQSETVAEYWRENA